MYVGFVRQISDALLVFLQPFQFADSCGRESADIVEETGDLAVAQRLVVRLGLWSLGFKKLGV